MLKWFKNYLASRAQKKKHDKLVNKYRDFATSFGDGLSYSYLGSPEIETADRGWLNEQQCWDELDSLEVAYASFGYRIIAIDDWISHGGYGKDIDLLWLVKRLEGERPVFTRNLMREENQ